MVLACLVWPTPPQPPHASTTILPEPPHWGHCSLCICLKNALPTAFSITPCPLHILQGWELPPVPLQTPQFIFLLYLNFLTSPKNTSSNVTVKGIFKLLPFLCCRCGFCLPPKNWLNTSSIVGPRPCLPWNGLFNWLSYCERLLPSPRVS